MKKLDASMSQSLIVIYDFYRQKKRYVLLKNDVLDWYGKVLVGHIAMS